MIEGEDWGTAEPRRELGSAPSRGEPGIEAKVPGMIEGRHVEAGVVGQAKDGARVDALTVERREQAIGARDGHEEADAL